jgi:hypothetical protein
MDEAGWEAVKDWLFAGTASLQYDFAMKPAVLKKAGNGRASARTKEKETERFGEGEKAKRKGCVVQ